jgi:hypothetical protein
MHDTRLGCEGGGGVGHVTQLLGVPRGLWTRLQQDGLRFCLSPNKVTVKVVQMRSLWISKLLADKH